MTPEAAGDNSHAAMLAALRDPAFYGVAGPVEVRETHISWVFLAGDRAYKLKKPVKLSFVDYGTSARRRAMCEEEVRLNRRLAPRIYLGVRAVIRRGSDFALGEPGAEGAVEHAVEMRRFDESHTLAAQLARESVQERDVETVGAVIAAFHRDAEAAPLTDAADRLTTAMEDTFGALDGLEGVAALRRFASAYMRAHRPRLSDRGSLAVDGHADLRAEHVVLGDPVQIVDCVEFDRELRVRDPASDLAFLAMDIEALGDAARARRLVEGYRRAGGDTGADHLMALYSAERALVRAKVDTVRAAQLGDDAALTARAADRIALARRLSWRARGPLPLVVCGLSGSGKSHLAGLLAARLGARVIASDRVRKELAGVAPAEHAAPEHYTRGFSARVYAELGARARAALEDAATPVVIDATAREAQDRRRLLAALGTDALFVRCVAPDAVLRERVRSRARAGGNASDADEAVLALQRFMPIDEVAPDNVIELRTDRPIGAVADALEARLDGYLASQAE